jgi:hypothetical protein
MKRVLRSFTPLVRRASAMPCSASPNSLKGSGSPWLISSTPVMYVRRDTHFIADLHDERS